jgi:predicted Zn-dependent protease
MPYAEIVDRFRALAANAQFCSLRIVGTRAERMAVRQDVLQPVRTTDDLGAMLTVIERGGAGYAATSDLSAAGLEKALASARDWARAGAGRSVTDFSAVTFPASQGTYQTPVKTPWRTVPLQDRIDVLRSECARLAVDARIVDREASLWHAERTNVYATSTGGHIEQTLAFTVPMLSATAATGAEAQTRTLGGLTLGRQGGWEIVEQSGFTRVAPRIGDEALELLLAPNCPEGTMDLLLAPDQMVLQIHESIGHPLELDRILGDERNYAGTSFVTPGMFGSYRYGSSLLNVTFDPTHAEQIASYRFDDDGTPARREYLIRDGILLRGLGGALSQARSGIPGVANSRATSWNRPPIDRMANLNLEPGDTPFAHMVATVERGVYMQANRSWSIDDSRNKFQFGCEWGRLIENGKLTTVVKNPNYRGISATFWRNLKRVGASETFEVLGTPYCGKGEPNQAIDVGHASPPCLFGEVEVFGGA